MELFVGPYGYRVYCMIRLTDTATGHRLDGGISFSQQEIYLDTSVIFKRRRMILLHEYWHAWLYHFGHPADEETQCDHFAACCIQFMDSLAAAGGVNALRCLEVTTHDWSPTTITKVFHG